MIQPLAVAANSPLLVADPIYSLLSRKLRIAAPRGDSVFVSRTRNPLLTFTTCHSVPVHPLIDTAAHDHEFHTLSPPSEGSYASLIVSYEPLTEECLLQPECVQRQLTSLVVKLSSLLYSHDVLLGLDFQTKHSALNYLGGTSNLSYRAILMSATKLKPNSACVGCFMFSFHGKPPPTCH